MAETHAELQLHYWPTPNGWKVTIFLEEVGAPYEVKFVNIGKGEQFQPDFLKISPNNRMPALIDRKGPGGEPISIFESGAILLYLGRKFARFYPTEERKRVEVESWLMWQMGGFGPMLGQNHHFRNYAPETIPYAIKRYEDEADRLYGVLDKRLEGRDFVAGGEYTIADMAIVSWARTPDKQGVDLAEFPNVARWREALLARPAVERGMAVGAERRSDLSQDKDAQAILFGQRHKRAG
ncbi:glutathione binding-like protein [Afifella pfennigii]|uniref:glutathione binding-like protein n=1 Tax=Afifella pfennigii TaxID=209897 RepID=UPI00047EC8EE|nr:glutathione binding-like protein [Afifella pfennigii]